VLQALVDADNVPAGRLRALLGALTDYEVALTVAGHADALADVTWPDDSTVVEAVGWQRADMVLAAAYVPTPGPLVIASGDGDFALLATRHPGPVLVVSEAAAGRLRDVATIVDPVHDGVEAITRWLIATTSEPDGGPQS